MGDWIVTPRRGKAVEINALWFNALCLLEHWLSLAGDARADEMRQHTEQLRASFNRRFWSDELGFLYDVIDGLQGDDPACRPNQILSFSLKHPVLDEAHWADVLNVVEKQLLTPVLVFVHFPPNTRITRLFISGICDRAMRRITREPSGPG